MVAVLHDLTVAARYATHVVALKDGKVRGTGTISEVMNPDMIRAVFDIEARVVETSQGPYIDYVGTAPS